MKSLCYFGLVVAVLIVESVPLVAQISWNRTITFAGREWQVKSGTGGPGPNNWSDSQSSVWVDSDGLHLKIRRVGSTWYCAEVRTVATTRHGMHRFYTVGRIDNIDRNVVFAPFLYVNDNREIDIEFSRWGVSTNPNAQYVLQPAPYVQGDNIDRFTFSLDGTHSTHYFNWTSSLVTFKSIHGHYQEPPNPNFLIRQFTYSGSRNPSESEGLRIHINLWLVNGQAPSNSQEVELIIAAADLPSILPPSAPTATSATSVTTSSFTANWNSVSGATGYRLDVATNSSFTNYVSGYQNLDVGNVTSRSVTGLSAGTTYYYRVRAYNSGGTSGNSNTISVTTTVNPPSAPTATSATSVTTSSFTANWNSVSGATGYRLDVATNASFTNYVSGYQNLDVGNVTSRSVASLSAGTTYYYRVRAYNSGGTSGNSNTISITTIPPAPTATAATSVTSNSFTANWNSANGTTGYRLDVATNSSFTNYVTGYQNLDVGNATNRNVTGLSSNTAYYYRVRAYNSNGTSDNSNTITVNTVTSVEQITSDIPEVYSLSQNYPNPFNPMTTIDFSIPTGAFVQLNIFNSLGIEIQVLLNQHLSPGYYRIRWTPTNIASGVYFYRLRSREFTETKKLLLLR